EPGVAAAVADDPAQGGVLVDEQAEAVGGGSGRCAVAGEAGRDGPAGEDLRQLHLTAAGRAQRMRVAVVPGRERGREAGHPAGEVADAAEDAAHGGEGA